MSCLQPSIVAEAPNLVYGISIIFSIPFLQTSQDVQQVGHSYQFWA